MWKQFVARVSVHEATERLWLAPQPSEEKRMGYTQERRPSSKAFSLNDSSWNRTSFSIFSLWKVWEELISLCMQASRRQIHLCHHLAYKVIISMIGRKWIILLSDISSRVYWEAFSELMTHHFSLTDLSRTTKQKLWRWWRWWSHQKSGSSHFFVTQSFEKIFTRLCTFIYFFFPFFKMKCFCL